MRSLIVASLLLACDAVSEETSLIQGLVARRGQISPDDQNSRQDATAKLMETATNMMKNGATPDVVNFIEATISQINDNVLVAILEAHREDEESVAGAIAAINTAVSEMETCKASVETAQSQRESASDTHKQCRSDESLACARSRRCEAELEELWSHVKIREGEMRRIHWAIHGEWCVGPDDPHPPLDDPWNWPDPEHMEGPETSQSPPSRYPALPVTDEITEFRRFSVDRFGAYIAQKPLVEEAWNMYNEKIVLCAALEETWTMKVGECDEKQDALHEKACAHFSSNRDCAAQFGHAYMWTVDFFENLWRDVDQKAEDRAREYETLHIVTCLLNTVYTHVIHAIESGEPCPTTESHPEETAAEINYCHVDPETCCHIPEPPVPPPPDLPPMLDPPCTAQYLWAETGSFSATLQTTHEDLLHEISAESEENLAGQHLTSGSENLWWADLSEDGWAGCAAPKACVPCASTELVVDERYLGNEQCKRHHAHLHPGEMDSDTFKCLSGDQCIQADGRCNDQNNCDDASDEEGCDAIADGIHAVLGSQECQSPIVDDVQFQCGLSNICTHKAGRCNGVNNCPNGEDEVGCTSSATSSTLTVEAMTGYDATIEDAVAVGDEVFHDRGYTFSSLGSFDDDAFKFIKMSNEDKRIPTSHVQMKLRLAQPTTIYVSKLETDDLSWLEADGWTRSESVEGASYGGMSRETRTTEWITRQEFASESMDDRVHQWRDQHASQNDDNLHGYDEAHIHENHLSESMGRFASQTWRTQGRLQEESYGPGEVWQKTFPAGVVEMRGDGGGSGSYLMFAAHPDHQVASSLGSSLDEWEMIAHQEGGSWFPSSTKGTYTFNANDNTAPAFMSVGNLQRQNHLIDGKFRFRLVYTGAGGDFHGCNGGLGPWLGTQEAEWTQTSWLTDAGVTGFEVISPSTLGSRAVAAGCQFRGLSRSTAGATVFDGSPHHGNWWHSVGSISNFGYNKIPAFRGYSADTMTLYVARAAIYEINPPQLSATPTCECRFIESNGHLPEEGSTQGPLSTITTMREWVNTRQGSISSLIVEQVSGSGSCVARVAGGFGEYTYQVGRYGYPLTTGNDNIQRVFLDCA